jgi:hypothetical protein
MSYAVLWRGEWQLGAGCAACSLVMCSFVQVLCVEGVAETAGAAAETAGLVSSGCGWCVVSL